jgi:hypothetical protein
LIVIISKLNPIYEAEKTGQSSDDKDKEARELSTYSTACATPWARWNSLKAGIEATRKVVARFLICTLNYAVVSSRNEAPDND